MLCAAIFFHFSPTSNVIVINQIRSDLMKREIQALTEQEIERKVITIRGQNVILDSDVAKLYGVETMRVNEAVKNNPDKFPEGYVFELSKKEKQEVIEIFDNLEVEKQKVIKNFDNLKFSQRRNKSCRTKNQA